MDFPACPVCQEGRLIPLSDLDRPFAFWICSASNCGYTIGRNLTAETYFKGTAASEAKVKGEKEWVEYNF